MTSKPLRMRRGIVYKDEANQLILLVMDPTPRIIQMGDSRDSEIYSDLDPAKADIVEVLDENEVVGLLTLRAIFGITLREQDALCPAHQAIGSALRDDPESLRALINENDTN